MYWRYNIYLYYYYWRRIGVNFICLFKNSFLCCCFVENSYIRTEMWHVKPIYSNIKLYITKERTKYCNFNLDIPYRKLYTFFNQNTWLGITELDERWLESVWDTVVSMYGITSNLYCSIFPFWLVHWASINRLDFEVIVVYLKKKNPIQHKQYYSMM